MKITLIALIAGLCLVAVNASVVVPAPMEDIDFEYIANDVADDVIDIETQVSWFGIYFVIHKALTMLKGVNCTIKEVFAIRDAAQKFLNDVQACGGEVSKKLQNLIDTCKSIVSTANDIIHVDENICGNTPVDDVQGTDDDSDVATNPMGNKTGWNCFWKLLFKTMKLKNEVKHAIYLIKHLPAVPGEAGDCVNTAAQDLASVFNQFPSNVKTCSKLVSKK
ncbi:uncharacterized protein LOC133325081 [Musca vetustissima]|uniref:uncharacterized protein LOC133325081 n=1 Tax=Musca vetustissima TaxID=27455 RepID=UPI002AB7DA9E|nr:uncharacterized protein LOC133325081 [Musca vetustissima]